MEFKYKLHVVAVPFLAQGHLIPFVELAKRLASLQVLVSYITTPANANRLETQFDGHSERGIRLIPIAMPSAENNSENTDTAASVDNIVEQMMTWHRLAAPFTAWLSTQLDRPDEQRYYEDGELWGPPACIIADPLADWLQEDSVNRGLPVAVFHLSGAYSTAAMHAFHNHHPQHAEPWNRDEPLAIDGLSFPCIVRRSEVAAHMRHPDATPGERAGFECYRRLVNRSMTGTWTLVNTFYELDYMGIQHLRQVTGKPVWAVGPLLPSVVFGTGGDRKIYRRLDSMGRLADVGKDECIHWLDSRPEKSVVLVCFGSQFFLSTEQLQAVAQGLENSDQSFIWAIRKPPGAEAADVLPEGFEERTKDRGMIIWGWAPQLMILSHPAVGAFFSHCGWNSTLESITLGVPIITWPMFADQPFISKLLVEVLHVAINVCVDVATMPDATVVAEAMRTILGKESEEGRAIRAKTNELSVVAKAALRSSGSSYHALNSFIAQVCERSGR